MASIRDARPQKEMSLIGRALHKRLNRPVESYEKRMVNNMTTLYQVVRRGDIVLVEGRAEISRIIKLMTNSTWSHSAIYVGDALEKSTDENVKRTLKYAEEPHRRHMLIEADSITGVAAAPLKKYADDNIRICRPFGISTQDLEMVVAEVITNLGKHYDHRNILDLGLMLLPSFLNPFKKRTIKACLGGCSEYEVICSGMIAKAFQKVGYPILPALSKTTDPARHAAKNPFGSALVMRHYSQIVPRDFDLSPTFEIIKHNLFGMDGFDYRSIWANGGQPGQHLLGCDLLGTATPAERTGGDGTEKPQ